MRFYLGADENQALARVSCLEALWNGVVTWWNDLDAGNAAHTEFACWDETTLTLGRAIGRGEWSVMLAPPRLDTDSLAVWLSPLRIYFPMIQVIVADPSKAEEGNQALKDVWQKQAENEEAVHAHEMRKIKTNAAPFGGKVVTRETLHDALDAYKLGWCRSQRF